MDLQSQKEKLTLTHPRALPVLFLTEMWERFSYYGMRALLILYAIKHLQFTDFEAGKLYGIYTGLVYLAPIAGGFLADQYLGLRRSIYIGGALMGLGHLFLAVSDLLFFYIGLSFLVMGNGFFKPNMSTLVGKLYEGEGKEALRDRGYTIFYMGINLGGFLGPLLCGYLGEEIGWDYGFSAAAIGMGIGLLVFFSGQSLIPISIGRKPESPQSHVAKEQNPIGVSFQERQRLQLILIFSIFSIFFWTGFEQAGSSMNLFADRYVDRNVFGWVIPASIFQALNPILILFFAPVFTVLWSFLNGKGREPDTASKFSIGLFLLGMGFVSLVMGSVESETFGKTSILYLFLAYLFNTWGELCLSPVGLSMVSRNAPTNYGSLVMGVWFLSNSVSHLLGGFLSGFMEEIGTGWFFAFFAGLSIVASLALFLLRKRIQKIEQVA